MAVRYLNATGTQALINEIKQRLALKADLTSLQALQQALDTVAASIPTNLSQLSNDADFVTATQVGNTYATKASVTELSGIVSQNQTAINLLNANNQTQGSVDYKIAQALDGVGGGVSILTTTLIYSNASDPSLNGNIAENTPITISDQLNTELLGLPATTNAFLLRADGTRAGGISPNEDILLCWRLAPKGHGEGDSWRGICLTEARYSADGGTGPYPFMCELVADPDIPGTFTWKSFPGVISEQEIRSLFV